jgi:hypothetical protein
MESRLQQEIALFKARLPGWLADGKAGKWAVIRGHEVFPLCESMSEALEFGYSKFGAGADFLAIQIKMQSAVRGAAPPVLERTVRQRAGDVVVGRSHREADLEHACREALGTLRHFQRMFSADGKSNLARSIALLEEVLGIERSVTDAERHAAASSAQ